MGSRISASQLDAYDECPKYYENRYILRKPAPRTGSMIAGSAYHKGIEFAIGMKISGNTPTLDEILEVAHNSWLGQVSEGIVKGDEDDAVIEVTKIDWKDENEETYRGRVLDLLKLYVEKQLPLIDAIAVEKRHQRELLPDVVVVGYIDTELKNGNIIDHKLTKRKKSQQDADNAIQPSVYAYLLMRPLICEYHQALDHKKPDIEVLATIRTAEDVEWCKDKMVKTYQLIQTGIFPPKSNTWRCSPIYCPYYFQCKIF